MDNLTHSLIGAAIGESAAQWRIQRQQNCSVFLRPAFWLASILANNFPDIDAVYSWITPGRLGYLLHHRGHTHTLLLALPQALIAFFIVWTYAFFQKKILTRQDYYWLAVLCAVGTFLHIFADSWNSYGVHPFWPFNNRWYYGDFLFIVEPWLWVFLLPPLYFAAFRNWLRRSVAIISVLALALIWYVPYLLLGWKICLTIGFALGYFTRWLSPQRRMAYALSGLFLVLAFFKIGQQFASAQMRAQAVNEHPHAELRDIALSPQPGNLACWSGIRVLTEGDRYYADLQTISIFPSLIPSTACPAMGSPYRSNFQGSVKELKQLAEQHCSIRAALQFLRAPYWEIEGETVRLGDLRFERRGKSSFSQFSMQKSEVECPPYLTNWTPPRADLFWQDGQK